MWLLAVQAVHLLAAIFWVGGMVFFAAVVMPALRRSLTPPARQAAVEAIGRRYRQLGWSSVGLLLITGPVLAQARGVAWGSAFGRALIVKLGLVALMLVLLVVHDLILGPRSLRNPESAGTGTARWTLRLARINLLIVLLISLCGLLLVQL